MTPVPGAPRGVVVPHASGARVVVTDVAIEDAWGGVIEGVPGERFFERALHDALLPHAGRVVRKRGIAHPPPAPGEERGRVGSQGPRAPHAPRWLVVAAADVAREDEEGAGVRPFAFGWFTNAALRCSVEELLFAGVHDVPLEARGDAHDTRAPPDARGQAPLFVSRDGATVWLDRLRVRFVVDGWPPDALAAWAPGAEHVPMARGIEAPVLVDASLTGPRIEGPRNRDAAQYVESELRLAWIAPAPGRDTLEQVVQRAVAEVAWHVRATPTEGP